MIDRERLEAMRAYAAEVREDFERREAEDPMPRIIPNENNSSKAPIVHKINHNALVEPARDQPPFTHEQSEILAAAIAQLRQDLDVSQLMQRVAMLEGQMSTLMTLLGGDASRSLEASETVRKLKVSRNA